MTAPRPLIAGNWKMYGLGAAVDEARKVAEALAARPARARAENRFPLFLTRSSRAAQSRPPAGRAVTI